jgi:aspartate/methionine/tyrosine aminotransferase
VLAALKRRSALLSALVEFLGAEIAPARLDYLGHSDRAGLDLDELEAAFKSGIRTFLFSNPNNPTGVIYSTGEIARIAELSTKYDAAVKAVERIAQMIARYRAA